jgi:hypothetical protein
LRLIGDFNIPSGEKFKETEIGGLSGITYDKKSNKLIVVSDDKSIINSSRFYQFEIKLDEKNFSVTPMDLITFKDSTGNVFKKHELDAEGITIVGDKLYVSSEGVLNRDKPILPAFYEFSPQGNELSKLPVPDKFLPSKDPAEKKMGARDNLSFEALTSTPDGKTLFMGMEEALIQDDNLTTISHTSKTRIIKYQDLKPVKEFLYSLDFIPVIKVAGLIVGETGLVDMAAIDENTSYTLERTHLPLAKKYVIKIFKIKDIDKTQDVSQIDSVKNKEIKPVEKELVLNLEDIIPSLSEKFKSLDNIEGICFGPTLPNGNKTLITVSDNNFSKNQRTQFLAFEIIP